MVSAKKKVHGSENSRVGREWGRGCWFFIFMSIGARVSSSCKPYVWRGSLGIYTTNARNLQQLVQSWLTHRWWVCSSRSSVFVLMTVTSFSSAELTIDWAFPPRAPPLPLPFPMNLGADGQLLAWTREQPTHQSYQGTDDVVCVTLI